MISAPRSRFRNGWPRFNHIAGMIVFTIIISFAPRVWACCCAECTPTVAGESAAIQNLIQSEH
ncbi:MAG TPA: hypothetical protein VIF12_06945, partial [Micavibrio sp.]